MNTLQLLRFPKLKLVLTVNLQRELTEAYMSIGSKKSENACMNIYSVFVDAVIRKKNEPYSALQILNNQRELNSHFCLLVGFLYYEFSDSISLVKRYTYARNFKIMFTYIASKYNLNLEIFRLRQDNISDDVKASIEMYLNTNRNGELLHYYQGWTCLSKLEEPVFLHFSTIFDVYGKSFTEKLYEGMSNYARTHETASFGCIASRLINLFNELTIHRPHIQDLEFGLKAENSVYLMMRVCDSMLHKAHIKGHNLKTFFRVWKRTLLDFTNCFINKGIFEEPLTPFVTPKYIEPKDSLLSISVGGKLSPKAISRYFGWIPLKVKDEEALFIISERMNNELNHIRIIAQNKVDEVVKRHFRNQALINDTSIISPKLTDSTPSQPSAVYAVANFYYYGLNLKQNYHRYISYKGFSVDCIRELNLPTRETIFPFLYLLVLEHPKITPSWLGNWKLFDGSGNQVGFRQVGDAWVALSVKPRKGAGYAQQEVILNERSKLIVENLIVHTEWAREQLRQLGGSDWQYVILKSSYYQVERLRKLTSAAADRHKEFSESCSKATFASDGKLILSEKSAKELGEYISLRGVRKAQGIKVYLDTKSILAVSETLGHKNPDLNLLDSYLPKPLMDYFNERWIRIFQNAILFEALQDSTFLIEALDFNEDELEEFLKNHKLENLPSFMDKARNCPANESNQKAIEQIDELKFSITTPLLQVLLAIKSIAEDATNEQLSPVIDKWYESAAFIISHFALAKESSRPQIKRLMPLYDHALANPINTQAFKGTFL